MYNCYYILFIYSNTSFLYFHSIVGYYNQNIDFFDQPTSLSLSYFLQYVLSYFLAGIFTDVLLDNLMDILP